MSKYSENTINRATTSTDPVKEFQQVIPARYQTFNFWLLSDQLVIYEALDLERMKPVRIWLGALRDLSHNSYQQQTVRLKSLNHPNLMPVYDHWLSQDEEFYGIVVGTPGPEYVELGQLINGPMAPEFAISIIRPLTQAIIYAQAHSELYLQLHPDFIRVSQVGKVKLEPYALTPQTQAYAKSLLQSNLAGLPVHTINLSPYQSPEQLLKGAIANQSQAQVYSLGVLTYELLAGFNPFRGATDTLSRLRHQLALPSLREVNPQVSPALEKVIQTALAKNWQGRYATAKDFSEAFAATIADTQSESIPPNIPSRLAQHRQLAREVVEFSTSRYQPATDPTPQNSNVEIPAALLPVALKAETLQNQPSQPAEVIPAKKKAQAPEPPLPQTSAPKGPIGRKSRLLLWLLFLVLGLILGIILAIFQNNSVAPIPSETPGALVAVPVIATATPDITPTAAVTTQAAQVEETPTSPTPVPDPWQPLMAQANQQIFEQGDFEKAIQAYRSLNSQTPDYAPAYRQLGMALYLSGRGTSGSEAVDVLKKAVALDHNDALAWTYLAFAYHDLYQYDKGLDAANTATNLNPKLPEAHAAQALLLLRIEDTTDRANQSFAQAAELDAGNFWVQWVHSLILKKERNTDEAIKVLDSLLNQYPKLAFLHTAKADVLRAAEPNRLQDATLWYQQALKLDNTYAYANSGLAWVYYFSGQYAQAEEAFNKALASRPGHAHSLTGLGYLKLRQRNYPDAIKQFTLAIQNDPREAEAYNGLASTYLNKGDMEQVLIWANLAIKYTPRYADPFYNKGRALYEMKDYQGSVAALESAVKLDADNPEYLEALAFAYYANGKKDQAKQKAQESLDLKPDNKTLSELLKLLD